MKYTEYSVQDFVKDEFFVQWVRKREPELSDFWEKWMREHPDKVATVQEAIAFIEALTAGPRNTMDNHEYLDLYESILRKKKTAPQKPLHGRVWAWYGMAASFVLALLAYYQYGRSTAQAPQRIVATTKVAGMGQKLVFALPDGTKAHLNSGSTLAYTNQYGDSIRAVSLSGEAYFVVAKDPEHPFVVQAGEIAVEALGTAFNVRSYPSDTTQWVALVEGKVKVGVPLPNTPVVLMPGQQAQWHAGGTLAVGDFDPAEAVAWKDGVLVLNEHDFPAIARKLERWYGVTISVSGNPPKDVFKGRFQKNESLRSVLEVMAYASGFTYTLSTSKATIKF